MLETQGKSMYCSGVRSAGADHHDIDVRGIDNMADPSDERTTRPSLSIRRRFEILKRDDFTCRYCGRVAPSVTIEVDHIVPVREGGSDDPINLVAACWDCNRGKSGVPLATVMPATDPVAAGAAVALKEAAIRNYEAERQAQWERIEADYRQLYDWYLQLTGYAYMQPRDVSWLVKALEDVPGELLFDWMRVASNRTTKRMVMAYVKTCARNWREANQ